MGAEVVTSIIKIPGSAVAVHHSKKAGVELIAVTLDPLQNPLSVAGRCGSELRGGLRKIGNGRYYLPDAKFNHSKMLRRAALVDATRDVLHSIVRPWSMFFPNRAAPISRADATMMLSALFGTVGKSKTTDNATMLAACVEMLAPGSDEIGEATGLWRSVSRSPVVVALAIKKLMYNSVFTSVAELRTAIQEAGNSVLWLAEDCDRWLKLLQASDRMLFEHDRAAWQLAYANVGADVVRVMQDRDEAGDEDEDAPPAARWAALEKLRLAKLIE